MGLRELIRVHQSFSRCRNEAPATLPNPDLSPQSRPTGLLLTNIDAPVPGHSTWARLLRRGGVWASRPGALGWS